MNVDAQLTQIRTVIEFLLKECGRLSVLIAGVPPFPGDVYPRLVSLEAKDVIHDGMISGTALSSDLVALAATVAQESKDRAAADSSLSALVAGAALNSDLTALAAVVAQESKDRAAADAQESKDRVAADSSLSTSVAGLNSTVLSNSNTLFAYTNANAITAAYTYTDQLVNGQVDLNMSGYTLVRDDDAIFQSNGRLLFHSTHNVVVTGMVKFTNSVSGNNRLIFFTKNGSILDSGSYAYTSLVKDSSGRASGQVMGIFSVVSGDYISLGVSTDVSITVLSSQIFCRYLS